MTGYYLRAVAIVALLLSVANTASAQFSLGIRANGDVFNVDFIGTNDEFAAWTESDQAKRSYDSVGSIIIRSESVGPKLSSCLRRFSKTSGLWLGMSPDGIELTPGTLGELNGLSSLESLHIYGSNTKAGELANVRGLNQLETLYVGGGIQINRDDLRAIGEFRKLEDLSLECQDIADGDWLENLAQLESLSLSAKRVHHDIKRFVPSLGRLTALSVYGIAFDEADLNRLAESHRDAIAHLALEIDDPKSAAALKNFSKLKSLDLHCKQSGPFPLDILDKLPELRILYVRGFERPMEQEAVRRLQTHPTVVDVKFRDQDHRGLLIWRRTGDKPSVRVERE
jgi:hypothetical protein